MKTIIGLVLVVTMGGCVAQRQSIKPSLISPTAPLLKLERSVTKTKQAISQVKTTDTQSQKHLQDAVDALSNAEKEIDELNKRVEQVISVADSYYESYIQQLERSEKLNKKVNSATKENWFWRLTFVGAILFATRKWWLRLLGVGL